MSDTTVIGSFAVDGEPIDPQETEVFDAPEPVVVLAEKPLAIDEVLESEDDEQLAGIIGADGLTDEERLALVNEYYPLPDGFPDRAQLEAWEAEFGKLRIHRIGPHEAYVVRALTRAEFRQYLAILKKKFGTTESDPAEERMVQEELLVERCCLWPDVTGADIRGESKPVNKIGLAGTVGILAYDVQEISNLVDTNVGPFEEL